MFGAAAGVGVEGADEPEDDEGLDGVDDGDDADDADEGDRADAAKAFAAMSEARGGGCRQGGRGPAPARRAAVSGAAGKGFRADLKRIAGAVSGSGAETGLKRRRRRSRSPAMRCLGDAELRPAPNVSPGLRPPDDGVPPQLRSGAEGDGQIGAADLAKVLRPLAGSARSGR